MHRGILFAFAAAVSWALAYVLQERILLQFHVVKLLLYQSLAIAAVSLIALIFFPPHSTAHPAAQDWLIVLSVPFGLLMVVLFAAEFFILSSVQTIGAPTATILEISYPIFTAILAYYILQEPIHWMTIIGAFFIMAGSGIVIYFR